MDIYIYRPIYGVRFLSQLAEVMLHIYINIYIYIYINIPPEHVHVPGQMGLCRLYVYIDTYHRCVCKVAAVALCPYDSLADQAAVLAQAQPNSAARISSQTACMYKCIIFIYLYI